MPARASDPMPIKALTFKRFTVDIIGTTPLLLNRMSAKVKAQLLLGGRKKTLAEKQGIKEAAKRLQDAEFNCYCARHDAIDAATAKITIDLEAASRLGHGAILAGYSKFPDMWQMLESIRGKITQSRRYREKRDEIYAEINDEFISLIEMYRSYKGSENIIVIPLQLQVHP